MALFFTISIRASYAELLRLFWCPSGLKKKSRLERDLRKIKHQKSREPLKDTKISFITVSRTQNNIERW